MQSVKVKTTAKRKSKKAKALAFRNKLILNQWLISLFGIDPLAEHKLQGKTIRPFHKLAEPIRNPALEGLDKDNLHHFFHHLANSPLFSTAGIQLEGLHINRDQLMAYEQNIVRHTQAINEKRHRPIQWKYYQWLTLLFVEVYLDRYFADRNNLLEELNAFIERFNQHYQDYDDLAHYAFEDLNKLCLQNATGSGKTLLMHVNLLQYRHYAALYGKENELSRVILITPNADLSKQHVDEFHASDISSGSYVGSRGGLFGAASGLNRVDVLEITKLEDKEGPNTIATRSLGDQNLLLVDEGHRGMSGNEQGVWSRRREALSDKGFAFEYSATFEQAVVGTQLEDNYAKAVLFDYSYRWFYEDGFGKDYQILNLPKSFDESQAIYITACLLKFYQQLRIYDDKKTELADFHIEKPLWVFVGNTVSSTKMNKQEQLVATDVALIIQFMAEFLSNEQAAVRRIQEVLSSKGQDTGLLDANGNDIFESAFNYLAQFLNAGETVTDLYRDILMRLFNQPAGGQLVLERIRGDAGEIALRVGSSETPFGLINVGETKTLCDHLEQLAVQDNIPLTVTDSDFNQAMFASVRESNSPINLLIGAKKFVEGWDCWRVSTLGLMHVGSSEGAQIIQLFGRGVRLKGHQWSLKRSGHSLAQKVPAFIQELETLNVFGIQADFMEKFRQYLQDEGLPGNERRKVIQIPLNVTYDFGKKLKTLRPKLKDDNGKEYDFKIDARIPTLKQAPSYLTLNKVVADWYPRIAAIRSSGTTTLLQKETALLREQHLALLDYDQLFFELERFKNERSWYNLNITKAGIQQLLKNSSWYTLFLPAARLNPSSFEGVLLLQQVASELLKRYAERYYNYCKREFMEPRLELRELTAADENIPQEDFYQVIVDGSEEQLIQAIEQVKLNLEQQKDDLLKVGDLSAINLHQHLFQPLLHLRRGSKISIQPVALNESEFQFVTDLKDWCDENKADLDKDGVELYLLRNRTRGKGVGFFEAGGFYPDFILWMLINGKQYVTFIEPHGLLHEGPGSEKVLFHKKIKDVEKRLKDPDVVLNSFILSWTDYAQLQWDKSEDELEAMHVLLMTNNRDSYIERMFARLRQE
ncbi:DEAD/DEAH box helicase family protein [Marinospirillum insulare]|uniref:Type III restriction endonuclease subunit R n=1 Tax=Marinospirillum insulare TaxID=217169 RepID=A0ABQ5ZS28_9GAMM|nr:DEAD/DEAH box helicase family protein [Marinospirillum insulare]GLR62934.1 type III restriction endonuclease subunit R [Marinospirillum insulare]